MLKVQQKRSPLISMPCGNRRAIRYNSRLVGIGERSDIQEWDEKLDCQKYWTQISVIVFHVELVLLKQLKFIPMIGE